MEAVLKAAPVVTDICIYGESTKSYVVALVCPARPALAAIAGRFGKADLTWTQLCKDKDVTGAVLREIINQVSLSLQAVSVYRNLDKKNFILMGDPIRINIP